MNLLTVKDVRTRLSLSRSTVYEWVAMGKIPGAVRVYGRLRFDPEKFEPWFNAVKENGCSEHELELQSARAGRRLGKGVKVGPLS